ncbi:hypothetical protein UY3_16855 [Chelonia mydas]|uniref:Uncharacterized protein n=1 Tax=Chelonia mydas TaxID=8469 RepID=M7ANF0_CHEMY|nr:hypothetical protein UY3_16855 [Chelonia mydas]
MRMVVVMKNMTMGELLRKGLFNLNLHLPEPLWSLMAVVVKATFSAPYAISIDLGPPSAPVHPLLAYGSAASAYGSIAPAYGSFAHAPKTQTEQRACEGTHRRNHSCSSSCSEE